MRYHTRRTHIRRHKTRRHKRKHHPSSFHFRKVKHYLVPSDIIFSEERKFYKKPSTKKYKKSKGFYSQKKFSIKMPHTY